VATRKTKKAQVLTLAQALDFISRHGIVCESARRGAVPSLAEAIAGEAIRGNWWGHSNSRQIFAITRAVREAPQVLVCRLVDGKITFVHERLWPILLLIADRLPHERLARVEEIHSASGKHELRETAFPEWIPAKVRALAKRLSATQAADALRLFDGLAQ
jgi:hypothetical protein